MSLAAETRDALRDRPFLLDALRAGVLNYRATAAFLNVGETDAVATALRRFRDDLGAYETESRRARVRMQRSVGVDTERCNDDEADPLLTVGDTAVSPASGSETAVLATGTVDARTLSTALDRLAAAGVSVMAAGVGGESMLLVVGRRDGATAVRIVESTLEGVPNEG